jgi:hypothetical protein
MLARPDLRVFSAVVEDMVNVDCESEFVDHVVVVGGDPPEVKRRLLAISVVQCASDDGRVGREASETLVRLSQASVAAQREVADVIADGLDQGWNRSEKDRLYGTLRAVMGDMSVGDSVGWASGSLKFEAV